MSDEKQPQSGAPNFNELEQGILKFWDENKIFEKTLQQTAGREPYIFYDGPPFATGLPHYGSILPSVIKDAIPRYQTMKGRYVRRRWGWDCHGLPIENIVEQHLKISGKKQIEEIGVDRFNQVCRDNVLSYAKEWGKTINRIARWVDFENSYKTMDTSYMESVWWAIKQVWDKGLIYEDRKVLLYCSRCETPISNFEVAMDNSYKDVTEESVYVKFKLLPRQRILNDLTNDKTYALAWTTTPWTLPGNTSLNVGPDISYVMVEQDGNRYILAKDRLSTLDGEYEMVAEFPARSLEGLEYEPLYPGVIPSTRVPLVGQGAPLSESQGDASKVHKVYIADFVTTSDGTGVVHNAAMYGEEDYQLAKEKNLPRVDMLDHKGQYLDRAPEHLRGVFFKDADKIVIQDLKKSNQLYKPETYTHSYPHCYRCGTPLFYNALPAWFINIQKIKKDLIKNNEEVNWYPEHLKHGRFQQGMENAPDWNISRNRYWATALPFWKCGCGQVDCIGSVTELIKRSVNFGEVYPAAADLGLKIKDLSEDNQNLKSYNFNLESLDLHKPYIDQVKLKCDKCGQQMTRVPEVVDCWVESGSMPFAELHYPFENIGDKSPEDFKNRFPSDFVVEYIPQTRAWFYVMHVVNSILFGKSPFKNVLTTGTILAEDGSKMSKSKNNYPDPNLVIEKYGADALRFYLLTSQVVNGEDLNFSEKGVQEVGRKVNAILYNVWSFLRLYSKGRFTEGFPTSKNVLDRWVLAKLVELNTEVTKQMDGYNTVKAGKAIAEFVNDLSTWYVRRSRDRIKGAPSTSSGPASGQDAQSALQTLGYVLIQTSKMLAPFMPFLSEFIFRDLTGEESVHLALWPQIQNLDVDTQLIKDMEIVREAVTVGLAARKEKSLPVRQPLQSLALELGENLELSPDLQKLVLEELNVKKINPELIDKDTRPEGVMVCAGSSLVKNFYLDLNLTPELKQEGLGRELERLVQDLRKKSGLQVGQLVDVYYNTQDEKIEDALLNLLDRKKTFVSQISKSLEVEVDFENQATVDGKAVWIGLIKI